MLYWTTNGTLYMKPIYQFERLVEVHNQEACMILYMIYCCQRRPTRPHFYGLQRSYKVEQAYFRTYAFRDVGTIQPRLLLTPLASPASPLRKIRLLTTSL